MRWSKFACAALLCAGAAAFAVGPPPASAPARPLGIAAARHVAELSRHAADLIEQRKFAEARRVLNEALATAPSDTTCLYDLACVDAATGDVGGALDDLGRAADAGFTDFTHLEHDPAFNGLRDLPRYRQLLARRDEIVRRTGRRLVEELKTRFGRQYLYDVDDPDKLIFAVHTDHAGLDEIERALRVEAASQWQLVFSHKPDEFIQVIVASPRDFARMEQRAVVGGRYDDTTRTVLVKRIGPELRHEFTHALHAADQHALDQEHPVWLSEGFATLYENPRTEPGDHSANERMLPNDTWRLARVQAAARHDTLIPLEQLLKMKRDAFTARADLAYGEAGSLLMYLYEHDLLRKFYDAYTAGYSADATGRLALERTTGLKLPELHKAWVRWLLPRQPPPRKQDQLLPIP